MATYFRRCGDDVRFFKGDLKKFAAQLLCEEYYAEIDDVSLGKYFPNLVEFVKTGKYSYLDVIPDFRKSELENAIKIYRQRFIKKRFFKI